MIYCKKDVQNIENRAKTAVGNNGGKPTPYSHAG